MSDGVAEMAVALQGLRRALGGDVLQRCTAAAAQPILAEAQARAPVRTGQVRNSLQIASNFTPNSASSAVEVAHSGPDGASHEAVFSEYGTSRQPARPFMRPAFEAAKDQAVQAFTTELLNQLTRNL